MKRFINLGTQLYLSNEPEDKEFAFYCTVVDKFKTFSNQQTWKSKQEFINTYEGDELNRYLKLIPEE